MSETSKMSPTLETVQVWSLVTERKLLSVNSLYPTFETFSAKVLQIHVFSEGLCLKNVTYLCTFLLRISFSLGLPFLTEFTKKSVF